jgi:gluconolactonase
MSARRLGCALGLVTLSLAAVGTAGLAAAPAGTRGPLDGRPDAIVDLDTREGMELVRARWRFRDAAPTRTSFRAVAADLTPTGAPTETGDMQPRPGQPGFDEGWAPLGPGTLQARRGDGRLSFAWYRVELTLPERVGALETTGAAVVFEIVVDDYAEVWVNGALSRVLGQQGGTLVAGFNAPNRVVLTTDARPGQRFDIAVFAANAPLSDPPANYIWVRSATLDIYRPAPERRRVPLTVVRRDPGLDRIVPGEPVLEHLASGFQFTEGPVWLRDGTLLFSDPNDNTIYRWSEHAGVSAFRTKSGYSGVDVGEYHQPGSNGLTLDRDGRLTIAEHGNRRISRLEPNGVVTVLAERHEGRRLNSPNDLVYHSSGALYFTDPPFGLPRTYDDPRRELPWSGVFRLADGQLTVVATGLAGPNGLAFSPDERYLYVTNWDVTAKHVVRYEVRPDGTLDAGSVLYDMTDAPGEEALDGIKVDREGHLYVSGPGGVWILTPDGRHLGTLVTPELAANMAWGDDGRTLYLTARSGLYRVRLQVPGIRPAGAPPTTR